MRERRLIRGLPVTGIASAGVVLGHWLAYVTVAPQAHVRTHLLAQSGHGYWTWAVKLAVVVGLAAVGALVVRSASRRGEVPVGHAEGFVWLLARLAPMQMLAFTVMEVTERAIVHAPVSPMFGRVYLAGIAIQLLVALIGSLVLLLLARVVDHVVRELFEWRPAVRVNRAALHPAVVCRPALSLFAGASGVRGPPAR